MVRRLAWVGLLASSTALADEGITVRMRTRGEVDREPLLHLEYNLPLDTEGLGGAKDSAHTVIDVGNRARIVMGGDWWKSSLTPYAVGASELGADDIARGWRGGLELSYDLGPFRVGANAVLGHVDSQYERGSYRLLGVSISRTFRLSRWMRGWISLGIGQQQWYGKPPNGEANNTTATLSIGTTFR
jgi:hypothetical protein